MMPTHLGRNATGSLEAVRHAVHVIAPSCETPTLLAARAVTLPALVDWSTSAGAAYAV